MLRKILIYIILFTGLSGLEAQFISEVLDYTPAPGQFINASPWGNPASAESITGGLNGTLCLGAFGGSVVFRFEQPVENHPDNPFGVDFTIFGNPMEDWSEPGVVCVMRDDNHNGLPDEPWYELAGSDYHFSSTRRDYRVTYTNPGKTVAKDVPWADQYGNQGKIKANSSHPQPYYPLADSFPDIPGEEYTLTGTLITAAVDVDNPPVHQSLLRAFGYADNQLRGVPPYTVPDNPYTLEVENSGGDGMDIGWAVDEDGNYVDLDRIHFVKVYNGVLNEGNWLGEVSTEITGAVDIPPGQGVSGNLKMVVIADLPKQLDTQVYQLEVFVFHAGRLQANQAVTWESSMDWASVDESNVLTVNGSGNLILTASLLSDPGITASVSTTVSSRTVPSFIRPDKASGIAIVPNPAREMIRITGSGDAGISIYDPSGKIVKQLQSRLEEGTIKISDLPAGIYLVRIEQPGEMYWLKLLKQ